MKEQDDKIYLRLMTPEDTDKIITWRNSDRVRKNFIYQELFTKESHENWIRTMIDTQKAVQFIICEAGTHREIGSTYLRDIDQVHKKAEYGIFIGEEDAAGKGIGTRAAVLTVQYGFEQLNLHRIFLRALSENSQAIRSYEKAGFEREGQLKDDVFLQNEFHDIILMAILHK